MVDCSEERPHRSSILRIVMLLAWWMWIASQKKPLGQGGKENRKTKTWELAASILLIACGAETVQYKTLTTYFGLIDMTQPATLSQYLWEYVLFVPKSLIVELVMDFFHYWTHRLAHRIKWLYRWAHAGHHSHDDPTPFSNYEQTVTDIVLTNMFPVFMALYIGPTLTIWQLHLFLTYKTYVEIGGHCGVQLKSGSFPQFPLLDLYTNYALNTADHHEHHRILMCNFSKRFRVWDMVFGTHTKHKNAVA